MGGAPRLAGVRSRVCASVVRGGLGLRRRVRPGRRRFPGVAVAGLRGGVSLAAVRRRDALAFGFRVGLDLRDPARIRGLFGVPDRRGCRTGRRRRSAGGGSSLRRGGFGLHGRIGGRPGGALRPLRARFGNRDGFDGQRWRLLFPGAGAAAGRFRRRADEFVRAFRRRGAFFAHQDQQQQQQRGAGGVHDRPSFAGLAGRLRGRGHGLSLRSSAGTRVRGLACGASDPSVSRPPGRRSRSPVPRA